MTTSQALAASVGAAIAAVLLMSCGDAGPTGHSTGLGVLQEHRFELSPAGGRSLPVVWLYPDGRAKYLDREIGARPGWGERTAGRWTLTEDGLRIHLTEFVRFYPSSWEPGTNPVRQEKRTPISAELVLEGDVEKGLRTVIRAFDTDPGRWGLRQWPERR